VFVCVRVVLVWLCDSVFGSGDGHCLGMCAFLVLCECATFFCLCCDCEFVLCDAVPFVRGDSAVFIALGFVKIERNSCQELCG